MVKNVQVKRSQKLFFCHQKNKNWFSDVFRGIEIVVQMRSILNEKLKNISRRAFLSHHSRQQILLHSPAMPVHSPHFLRRGLDSKKHCLGRMSNFPLPWGGDDKNLEKFSQETGRE